MYSWWRLGAGCYSQRVTRRFATAGAPPPVRAALRVARLPSTVPAALPLEVEARIRALIDRAAPQTRDKRVLAQDAMRVSEIFRTANNPAMHGSDYEPLAVEYGRREAVAYAVSRMPSTYAAIVRVLREIRERRPGIIPEAVLDFGSGCGTAILAAHEVFGDGIERYVAVERSGPMQDVARFILPPDLRAKVQFQYNLKVDGPPRQATPLHGRGFDLVLTSYVLGEIESPPLRRQTLRHLWRQVGPQGLLAAVEAGTPRGSLLVQEARKTALEEAKRGRLSGHVVAPCSHDGVCPLETARKLQHARGDATGNVRKFGWCHFGQRVQRHESAKIARRRSNAIATERFSYVAVGRGDRGVSDELALAERVEALRSDAEPHAQGVTDPDDAFGSEEANASAAGVYDDLAAADAPDESHNLSTSANGSFSAQDVDEDHSWREEDDAEVFADDEWDSEHEANAWRGADPVAISAQARLIRPPLKRGKHTVLDLCCSDGILRREVVTKRRDGADVYRVSRKLKWGDSWPFPVRQQGDA